MNANKTYFRLYFTNCSYDPNEKEEFKKRCNRDTIPLGKRALQFVGTCDYCDKQNFTVSIDICIWRNSSKECEVS